jgi:archaellum biogenesis ATPase FlaH
MKVRKKLSAPPMAAPAPPEPPGGPFLNPEQEALIQELLEAQRTTGEPPDADKLMQIPEAFRGRAIHIEDIVPGLVPGGGISLLSGASGMGKSSLLAGWIAKLQKGDLILGMQPRVINRIGMIVTDRRHQEVLYWLESHGVVESDRFRIYCVADDFGMDFKSFSGRGNFGELKRQVELLGIGHGDLLIVDPISPYTGSKTNDYASVVAALGPINRMLGDKGITVIGTVHTPKLKADENERTVRAQDRLLGSTALAAFTNTQIALIGDEEHDYGKGIFLLQVVSHKLPPMLFEMTKDEAGRFVANDTPIGEKRGAGKEAPPNNTVKRAVWDVVLQVLGNKTLQRTVILSLTASTLNKDDSQIRPTLDRVLKEMLEENLLVRVPEGYRRILPEQAPKEMN